MGPETDASAGVRESGQEVSPDKPVVATPSAGSAAEPGKAGESSFAGMARRRGTGSR
jgi:hypothetical protein